MIIGFFHNVRLNKNKNIYYSTTFDKKLWDRYLVHFDNILVCTRYVEKDEIIGQISSTDNVEFDCIKCTGNRIIDTLKINLSKSVRKHIKKCVEKVDFAIIRLPSEIGAIAFKECKKQKKPCLIELVGCPWDSLWNHSLLGKLLAPYATIRVKHLVKKASHVLYVSQQFLQNKYPNKKHNIGCPDVILDKPSQLVLDNRLARINDTGKRFTLGLIGNLDLGYRGHKRLLDSAKILQERGIEVDIRFLGSGDSNQLVDYAKEIGLKLPVFFDGTLPHSAVLNWLDGIDCLVMPTQAETLGRAIIEAMSRGCAVVGSLETAIPEQIGFDCVRSYKDIVGFADVLEKLYNNKEYYRYTALENFHRSFKYCNEETDYIRNKFYKEIIAMEKIKHD